MLPRKSVLRVKKGEDNAGFTGDVGEILGRQAHLVAMGKDRGKSGEESVLVGVRGVGVAEDTLCIFLVWHSPPGLYVLYHSTSIILEGSRGDKIVGIRMQLLEPDKGPNPR